MCGRGIDGKLLILLCSLLNISLARLVPYSLLAGRWGLASGKEECWFCNRVLDPAYVGLVKWREEVAN